MGWYSRKLNQLATYWDTSGSNDFGEMTFQGAETLNVRWTDEQELFRDVDKQEVMSNAIVYLKQSVNEKGYLGLGRISSWDESVGPFDDYLPVYEIRKVAKIPDLKGNVTVYKVWL